MINIDAYHKNLVIRLKALNIEQATNVGKQLLSDKCWGMGYIKPLFCHESHTTMASSAYEP
jgi:hypothetical protein